MQQLSGQDASFIYGEQAHAPTHITSIAIYDPSTAPGGDVTFDQILGHIDARLHLARAFRQRVVRVPADLDHPYWLEDGDFDLEYHVRQLALPRPGDWQQFCTQAARLHAHPLDLSRPLWELYVIEGLDGIEGVPAGSFGTVLKVHHAAVDGKSGVEMITVMHTQTPAVDDPPPPDEPWQGEEEPSPVWLYGQAMLNAVRVPGRAMRLTARLTPGVGRALRTMREQGERSTELAPGTRFAGPVTSHRVLDAEFFPFAALRAIRDLVPGATVNDVALAILGGALRTYLADIGELPSSPMRAMTPVSVRTESERADLGNQVSAMIVSLATDIADPVERLAAVHRSTSGSKQVTEAIGARNLTELSQLAPGLLIGVGARLGARFARRGNAGLVNTVVTNVPGPREPLYLAGARCLQSFGAGPVVDGMGIINIVGSYDDLFVLSFTACREMMPDPARYAAAIRASFDEYVAAAEAAAPAVTATPKARRPARRRKASARPAVTSRGRASR